MKYSYHDIHEIVIRLIKQYRRELRAEISLRTYYFETSTGFDPAKVILRRYPVQSSILPHYVDDLEYFNVVPFFDGDPRAWRHHGAILVPFYPRRGMADHGALEAHSLAFLDQTIVRHRVELWRTDLRSSRNAASRQDLWRPEFATIWKTVPCLRFDFF